MCGRLSLSAADHRAAAELLSDAVAGFEPAGLATWLAQADYRPHHNLGPGQIHWLIRGRARRPILDQGLWGLEHRGAARSKLVINARAESIDQRPMFRAAFAQRRGLIPADGFFEWQREGGKRLPHWFHRDNRETLLLAAVYEPPQAGAPTGRFCVVTKPANDSVRWVHKRMPVVIEREQIPTWLFGEAPALHTLMHEASPRLSSFPVSPAFNSPRHDRQAPVAMDRSEPPHDRHA